MNTAVVPAGTPQERIISSLATSALRARFVGVLKNLRVAGGAGREGAVMFDTTILDTVAGAMIPVEEEPV